MASRISALLVSCALVAAACGVPDDVATEDGEVTLESLTPVAPAEDAATETGDGSDNQTTTEAAVTSTSDEPADESTAENETESDPDPAEPAEEDEEAEGESESDDTSTTSTDTTSSTTTSSTSTTSSTTTTTTTNTTAAASSTRSLPDIELELELVASLTSPVAFATRPGSTDVFIAEQRGRIVRLPGGSADAADSTLDIRGAVSLGNEQGLLGLAFAPDGQRLYVNYTNPGGSTVIARYSMSGNSAVSPEVLLTIAQPYGNHNGGQLAFGPDGMLYIGLGDGGSGGDPEGNGQNPNTLHGSILRIDVSSSTGYEIPAGNPFVDGGGAPEVFVWGIRNAWRFGFDSATGDLWVGDVGQNRMEEVTVLRSGTASGANLGWNLVEGTESFSGLDAPAGHVSPIITYSHGSGRCSITGGEVYRGSEIPGLVGAYVYGDFCSGEVFGFRANGQGMVQRLDLAAVDQLSSFGIGPSGEMYVLSRGGGVFRLRNR